MHFSCFFSIFHPPKPHLLRYLFHSPTHETNQKNVCFISKFTTPGTQNPQKMLPRHAAVPTGNHLNHLKTHPKHLKIHPEYLENPSKTKTVQNTKKTIQTPKKNTQNPKNIQNTQKTIQNPQKKTLEIQKISKTPKKKYPKQKKTLKIQNPKISKTLKKTSLSFAPFQGTVKPPSGEKPRSCTDKLRRAICSKPKPRTVNRQTVGVFGVFWWFLVFLRFFWCFFGVFLCFGVLVFAWVCVLLFWVLGGFLGRKAHPKITVNKPW